MRSPPSIERSGAVDVAERLAGERPRRRRAGATRSGRPDRPGRTSPSRPRCRRARPRSRATNVPVVVAASSMHRERREVAEQAEVLGERARDDVTHDGHGRVEVADHALGSRDVDGERTERERPSPRLEEPTEHRARRLREVEPRVRARATPRGRAPRQRAPARPRAGCAARSRRRREPASGRTGRRSSDALRGWHGRAARPRRSSSPAGARRA